MMGEAMILSVMIKKEKKNKNGKKDVVRDYDSGIDALLEEMGKFRLVEDDMKTDSLEKREKKESQNELEQGLGGPVDAVHTEEDEQLEEAIKITDINKSSVESEKPLEEDEGLDDEDIEFDTKKRKHKKGGGHIEEGIERNVNYSRKRIDDVQEIKVKIKARSKRVSKKEDEESKVDANDQVENRMEFEGGSELSESSTEIGQIVAEPEVKKPSLDDMINQLGTTERELKRTKESKKLIGLETEVEESKVDAKSRVKIPMGFEWDSESVESEKEVERLKDEKTKRETLKVKFTEGEIEKYLKEKYGFPLEDIMNTLEESLKETGLKNEKLKEANNEIEELNGRIGTLEGKKSELENENTALRKTHESQIEELEEKKQNEIEELNGRIGPLEVERKLIEETKSNIIEEYELLKNNIENTEKHGLMSYTSEILENIHPDEGIKMAVKVIENLNRVVGKELDIIAPYKEIMLDENIKIDYEVLLSDYISECTEREARESYGKAEMTIREMETRLKTRIMEDVRIFEPYLFTAKYLLSRKPTKKYSDTAFFIADEIVNIFSKTSHVLTTTGRDVTVNKINKNIVAEINNKNKLFSGIETSEVKDSLNRLRNILKNKGGVMNNEFFEAWVDYAERLVEENPMAANTILIITYNVLNDESIEDWMRNINP